MNNIDLEDDEDVTVSAIFINLLLDNESSRGGSGSGQDSTQLLVCVSVWLESPRVAARIAAVSLCLSRQGPAASVNSQPDPARPT